MKVRVGRSWKLEPKFSATPPMRNEGSSAGFSARGDLVDPGQHAGGGGFAVGSGDDEGLAACEELFAQQRGHGGEGNALVEDALDFGIAAGERVADDDEIGRGREVRFGVGLEDGNAERAEQIAHGRIGGFVGAGDAMALRAEAGRPARPWPCRRCR